VRIYPTYWVACLIAIVMNALAAPFNHVPLQANLPGSWNVALANLFLVEPYVGVPAFLLVSWSLVYELGFYVLAAVGFALWRRGGNPWLLLALGLACGIAALLGVHEGIFYVLRFWPEFFCGVLVFSGLWLKMTKARRAWWPLLGTAGFAVVGVFSLPSGERVGQMIGAAAFAWLLFFLHPMDARITGWRPLRWLAWVGTISYSLYLTHITFMGKVLGLASRRIASDSMLQLAVQVASWGAAILGAWIIFKFCEQPLERWRRSLRRRSFAPLARTMAIQPNVPPSEVGGFGGSRLRSGS
jgi:peptidoglycan/LPS O-acetylase OafA/YrhL